MANSMVNGGNDWDNMFITISLKDTMFAFVGTGTTTYEDIAQNAENLKAAVKSVVDAVSELEEGETITEIDFMNCFLDTVSENFTNAAGDSLTLRCIGVGAALLQVDF